MGCYGRGILEYSLSLLLYPSGSQVPKEVWVIDQTRLRMVCPVCLKEFNDKLGSIDQIYQTCSLIDGTCCNQMLLMIPSPMTTKSLEINRAMKHQKYEMPLEIYIQEPYWKSKQNPDHSLTDGLQAVAKKMMYEHKSNYPLEEKTFQHLSPGIRFLCLQKYGVMHPICL